MSHVACQNRNMSLEETTSISTVPEKQEYNDYWKRVVEKLTTPEKTENSKETMLEEKDYEDYNFEYDESLLAIPTPI